jgi:hypothetical protein
MVIWENPLLRNYVVLMLTYVCYILEGIGEYYSKQVSLRRITAEGRCVEFAYSMDTETNKMVDAINAFAKPTGSYI